MLSPSKKLTESEISELINNAEIGSIGSNRLQLDPAIPEHDSPPDREKMAQWVATHQPKDKPIAQKIADNIRYVSFDEFYQMLIQCAAKLNAEYEKSNIKGDEVIIAVPFATQDKSNGWVTSLLLPHLNFKPKKIIEGLATRELRQFLANNKDVKRILVADDASYSGVDLSLIIDNMNASAKAASPQVKIDLVVPFITKKARDKLSPYCQVWSKQEMPTLDELPFTEDEKYYLDFQNISGYPNSNVKIDRLTLTYFAHKMADSYSIPEKLLRNGLSIPSRVDNQQFNLMMNNIMPKSADFNQRCPFIPEIIPCYKQRNPKMHLSDKDKKSGLRM